MRRTATILASSASDARRHQLCGVVSHLKDRPMPPRTSPTTVRNWNVYICRPEPTCVSSRQHLHALLTWAGKRQRRLHLQAGADSRQHVPSSASNCQHLQVKASIRFYLQTGRSARPEGAPCL
jgi:hypothetical protein